MDWKKLKEGMCPSGCGGRIKPQGLLGDRFYCEFCTFRISEKRYNEILSKKKNMVSITDNLSQLNNMGHKKVSEDYSDEIKRLDFLEGKRDNE